MDFFTVHGHGGPATITPDAPAPRLDGAKGGGVAGGQGKGGGAAGGKGKGGGAAGGKGGGAGGAKGKGGRG